jgi:hypothetical protein
MIDRRSSLLLGKSLMREAQASPEMNGEATAIHRDICWSLAGIFGGSRAARGSAALFGPGRVRTG